MKCRGFLVLILILAIPSTASADPFLWKDVEIWTKAMAQALAHPADPREEGFLPSDEDRELLERFKPRIYVAPGGAKPIDFYTDYLPHTIVRHVNEKNVIQERAPSRVRLKDLIYDTQIFLEYAGEAHPEPSFPTAYARLTRETVNLIAGGLITTRRFMFLKYHYVFLYGGLPFRLSTMKEKTAGFAGDAEKWRELEHSSVYVILDEQEQIIALMLGQYDHFRTYLAERDEWSLPPDGRAQIAFSMRSNQPYGLPEGQNPIQKFAILDFKEIPYLLGQGKEPMLAGVDDVYSIQAGGTETDYRLEYLPRYDPLYVSRIPLGRRVYFFNRVENPLRRGSLGIDFCTWPQLADLGNLMQFWFIVDGHPEQAGFMREHMRRFLDIDFEDILTVNAEIFGRTLMRDSPQNKGPENRI